jgi:hypothetical protein
VALGGVSAKRTCAGAVAAETLVHLLCALVAAAALGLLGPSLERAIASEATGSPYVAPFVAPSAQAGVGQAAHRLAGAAVEARVPRSARPIRYLDIGAFLRTLEEVERGAPWSTVRKSLAPAGDAAWILEDALREITRAAGRESIATYFTHAEWVESRGTAASALAAALRAGVRWGDSYADSGVESLSTYFALASEKLEASGASLPRRLEGKLTLIERIFHGGATTRDIRAVYGDAVRVVSKERFLPADYLVRRLPARGSPEWDALALELRTGILDQRFAVLPTSKYLPPAVGARLRGQFEDWVRFAYDPTTGATRSTHKRPRADGFEMFADELTVTSAFADWQRDLVQAAFPDDVWSSNTVALHAQNATDRPIIAAWMAGEGEGADGRLVQAAHYDPEPLVSSIDFVGPGTVLYPHEVRAVDGDFQNSRVAVTEGFGVPTGDLVFFTGRRAPATRSLRRRPMLHGSPPQGSERMFAAQGFRPAAK